MKDIMESSIDLAWIQKNQYINRSPWKCSQVFRYHAQRWYFHTLRFSSSTVMRHRLRGVLFTYFLDMGLSDAIHVIWAYQRTRIELIWACIEAVQRVPGLSGLNCLLFCTMDTIRRNLGPNGKKLIVDLHGQVMTPDTIISLGPTDYA